MKARIFRKLVFMVIIQLVISLIVMLSWNWLLPNIFVGVAHINYWQAIGIFILCRLLFGSSFRFRREGMGHEMRDRNRIREKWMNMTPEQKEAFMKKRNLYGRNLIDFFDSQPTGKED